MINFKEEILKYEPILEIDDIEKSIFSSDLQDILDLLKYTYKQSKKNDRTESDDSSKTKE